MADAAAKDDEVETTPKSAGGIVGLMLPPVLAAGAAFAATFFLGDGIPGLGGSQPPSSSQTAEASGGGTGDVADGDDPKKGSKKKKGDDQTDADKPDYLLPLDPIIVSLAQPERRGARAPRLRIVVSVSGSEADPEKRGAEIPHLRDAFTRVIRSLSAEELSAAGGLELLRARLLSEAMDILGTDGVSSVLITDFIIT